MVKQHTHERDTAEADGIVRTTAVVRARAVALGLVLVPLLCWWSLRTEIISGGSEMIEASLLVIVVFVLLLLVLANEALRRLWPRAALTRAELLVVYVMQTTSVGLAGLGQIQFLNQALGGAYYYKTPQNHWADFQRFIPSWWVPDPSVLPDYYHGQSTLFTAAHLRGWAAPIVSWTVFIALMLFCFLCVNTMLRRHWVEGERLAFPLVALPLELTRAQAGGPLLRQRPFWLAFALVCVYRSVSGLHRILPTFPDFPNVGFKGQLVDLTTGLTQTPWNALGFFQMGLHPMIVGITYFVPQDISFSLWFFYLVTKVENVLASAWGFRDPGAPLAAAGFPYTGEQGGGAFLALALFSLWGARRHLGDVWRKAFGRAPQVRDDDEPLSYRVAVFGFLLSFSGLVAFVSLGGMAWYLAAAFFALYLLMIVTVTRLRAEAGPMLHYGPDMNPHQIMVALPGSRAWDAQNLTPFSYLQWFDSDYRTVAMPQQMEALKIGEAAQLPGRSLARWMLGAGVLAALTAFVSVLALYYHYGAITGRGDNPWRSWNGQAPFTQLAAWLHNPEGPAPVRLEAMLVGFVLVAFLSRMRTLFVWWPFHPAGFVLAHAGWSLPWVWFPTLLGWAAKALILRYGGIGLFRQCVPVFMGLVLGDITAACVWSLLGVLLNTQMYMFFPG